MTIPKGKTGPQSATTADGLKKEVSSNSNNNERKNDNGVETKISSNNADNSSGIGIRDNNNNSSRVGHIERVGRWHNTEEDMPIRRVMIQKIVELLKKKKPGADENWKKKLPDMARRLEDSLYRSASSRQHYADEKTLKARLQEVAIKMTKRKQMQQRPKTIPLDKIDDKMIKHYAAKFDEKKREQFLSLPVEKQKQWRTETVHGER